MSLSEDFGMYYNSTYVGYRKPDGSVVPFYVESVEHDNDVLDLSSLDGQAYSAIAYSDVALNALRFYGILTNSDGRNMGKSVCVNEGKLVFELPDSRYIKYLNQYYWVSYRAQRTTKKGISARRITGVPNFDYTVVAAMFSEVNDENIIGNCFLKKGDELHYKGVHVGDYGEGGDSIVLVPEASHLVRPVQRELPQCQISVSVE